ncbi:MAG: hypothetical protein HY660_02675 [Armatimonadetes bacterium]|nr:hypothetical protein [Armatimonadota bacterium]
MPREPSSPKDWTQPFLLLQPNLRIADAPGLDPAALVREAARYGADVYLANGGGLVAWYPTRLAYQRPCPGLACDYLGQVTEAAHARGMRVLARIDATKGYEDDYRAHPDWFRVTADGHPVRVRELVESCFTGPYWQQFAFEIADEILTRYPVDGIFFNAYRYPTCSCPRCAEAFAAATGHDLPRREDWEDPAWRALVEYRYGALAEYTARMVAAIRRRRPGAILGVDQELVTDDPRHSRESGWGPALTRTFDLVTAIAFNRLTRPLPRWIYQAGEAALMGREGFGLPTCVLLTYSAIFGNRRAAQPPAQMARDIIAIAAHGGSPGVALSGTFAQEDRKALGAIRETHRFLRVHRDLYARMRPAANVAVVYSQRTADYYGRGDPWDRYLSEYRGIYEALVHAHVPFSVAELEVLVERGTECAMLVLPNAACLGDAEAAWLDAFVARGGRLLVTYETGLYDGAGRRREDFALGCLGRRAVETRSMAGAYLRIADRRLLRGLEHADLLPLGMERPYGGFGPLAPEGQPSEGMVVFTKPSPDASDQRCDLMVTNPVTNNVPEFSYWEGEAGTPGLVVNRHGDGVAVYLPWMAGRLYHRYGVPEVPTLIGRLVDAAMGWRRPLLTDAPASVEVTLHRLAAPAPRAAGAGIRAATRVRAGARRGGDGWMVHLINATGLEGKPLPDVVPVHDIEVRVLGKMRACRALALGKRLPVTYREGYSTVRVPRLASHEVLICQR